MRAYFVAYFCDVFYRFQITFSDMTRDTKDNGLPNAIIWNNLAITPLIRFHPCSCSTWSIPGVRMSDVLSRVIMRFKNFSLHKVGPDHFHLL